MNEVNATKMSKNLLAISGSIRAHSANTSVLKSLQAFAPEDVYIHLYEGIDRFPHFNPDITDTVALKQVNEFRDQLRKADGVIICTPEYAFGLPGVLKNALDWLVSSGEFTDKPTATISASPLVTGADKAHAQLIQTLKVMGAKIPAGASLTIPAILKKIDDQGRVNDQSTIDDLSDLINTLIHQINQPVSYEL